MAISAGQAATTTLELRLVIRLENARHLAVAELRNTSDGEVAIIEDQADNPFSVDLTDPAGNLEIVNLSAGSRRLPDQLPPSRLILLKPGESCSRELGWGLRADELPGRYVVKARYEPTRAQAAGAEGAGKEKVWLGKVVSLGVAMDVEGKLHGVGAVENPIVWAHKHKKDTLRLSLFGGSPALPSQTATLAVSAQSRFKLPQGWGIPMMYGAAGWFIFRDTGAGQFWPVGGDPPRDRNTWLRAYALPDEVAKQQPFPKDYTWLRELDGAKVRYRVVTEERYVMLFEVWDEEWEVSKPEMEECVRLVKSWPLQTPP
ncbi:MAG: hypothetical protein NTW87_00950 [Planctomycetota bacterium]|nr:hypothetical protein [Planctomycetota bacterium]